MYTTFQQFRSGLEANIKCGNLKGHLRTLLRLYAVYELIKDN